MAISTNGTVLTRLVGGLYNTTLSNASYTEDVAKLKTSADVNSYANDLYARDFAGKTDLAVANILLGNLNLSSVTGLNNWVSAQLTAAGNGNKGAKLVSMLNDFSNMTADATYGTYANAFNAKVAAALGLAQTPGSIGSDFSAAQTGTQVLTASIDTLTGNKFSSTPTYTPGGNDFVNTLQDEDTLTGSGTNPTLTVTLGSVNDAAESTIVPKLIGIETVAIQSTGSTAGINFQDSKALKTVTVDRITQNNAGLTLSDIDAAATTYNLNNATRAGVVTFASKEEVLTGAALTGSAVETLGVNVNNSRASALNLTEGTDGGADAGYYYEVVNMTTTGNNDLDAVTVQQNGMEDTLWSLTAGTTTQTLNIVANGTTASGYLEINSLTASGVETMTIQANARVDIAANKMVALTAGAPAVPPAVGGGNDGISTADLETLTITGAANVMIDGLDTTKLATKTLTVSAGTMTGDLKLGVATASDASLSSTYATRTDKDLSVTSGSGNDQVVTYTSLAGDITTNAGNDIVRVGNAATSALSLDAEGVSTISTGEGNDTVVAKDLLVTANDKDQTSNTNFDDVTAATITTGDGNDSVTVGALTSGSDWDNITITDGNLNDQQFVRGASISTGAGNDTVVFTSVAEGASVDAGEGDDAVSVSLTATATILATDTDADVQTVVTATQGDSGSAYTDEVTSLGVADRLGAVVDLGAGTADVISFTESDTGIADTAAAAPTETSLAAYTLIARDAELRGAETMNVTALDAITVTTTTTMADQDSTLTGTQTDINANVVGTVTANFTILNQVEDTDTADTVVAHNTVLGSTVNDNNATDGSITANVMRFDSSLAAINLVSSEQTMQTGAATEVYEAGTKTTFTLTNLREGIALSLAANEATGVAAGVLTNDTLLAISTTTLAVTRASAADVTLNLDYDAARGLTNAAALNVAATSEAFDLDLNIGATTTDTLVTAVTTDDDAMRIENFTINFADANSHSVDANGFGDNVFRATRAPVVAGDVSSTAATTFTVNSAAAAGSAIQLDAVNADVIAFNNAAGTAVTAANVTLAVDASNNYTITTGAGTDIIDMRADDVRSDDITTTVDRADRISAGEGRDTLIVNGNDDLGSNDNAGVSASTIVNDDVFQHIDSVETILVGTTTASGGANGDLMITIDEQSGTGAGNTNVDTIRMIGNQANKLDLVVGNNFTVAATVNTTNIAAGALLIDTSANAATTILNIENKDDDSDIQLVNMDIRVGSKGGSTLTFVNSGSQLAQVEVRAYSADENDVFTITDSNAGNADGLVDLNGLTAVSATAPAFDKLVLLEGSTANDNAGGGTYGTEAAVTVNIESSWTNDTTGFTLDASALLNTDDDTTTTTVEGLATGGATITVDSGDLAALTVSGTQNSDTITTGRGADVVNGNDGNDTIVGDEVNNNAELEVVTFAATYDAGDVITVTHNGQSITATIGVDGVTAALVATAIAGYDTAGSDGIAGDNIVTAGTAFSAATSAAAGSNLRLTGATAGTDYVVTSTTTNTPNAQTLSIAVGDGGDHVTTIVWNGNTYSLAQIANVNQSGLTAFLAAVVAAGGTSSVSTNVADGVAGTEVITISGAVPLITQVTAVSGSTSVALAVDVQSTQANPTVATETLARSVIGAADTINGGAGDDNITGLVGADILDGGAGLDTVNYQLSLAAVSVNLATNVVSGGDAQGDVITNFENITGTVYADTLTGSSAANVINGGAGNDTISSAEGDDTITAGEGADIVNGGAGVDIITLTETTSAADRVTNDAAVAANADSIVGFTSGTDKFQYTGTLQNALGTNSDGVAGTDVITAATLADGLLDANSTAGVVFIATNNVANNGTTNLQGDAFTALLGATTAATIASTYATLEAALIATGGTLNGVITGLDTVLITTDSALLVLDNGTGSVVLRITNTDINTTTPNTLTGAEIELVGVFTNTAALAAGDFI